MLFYFYVEIIMKYSKQLNLLLVDDSSIIRMSFKYLLNRIINLNVIGECSDGSEVIPFLKLHKNKVDVIFMDVIMKVVDGFEATRKVKEHNPKIKVIGLSSTDHTEIISKMMSCGADGFISKFDVDKERIIVELQRIMKITY